ETNCSRLRATLTRAEHPDRQRRQAAQVLAMPPDPRDLRAEANHLHRALFGGDAPEEVREQYASALQAAPLAAVPGRDLTRLIDRGIDREALELALRRRTRANALTQRFQVLCYLAEARPEYYSRFVNESPRFLVGWLALALHTVRSVYKLIKGRCLIRIHDVQ